MSSPSIPVAGQIPLKQRVYTASAWSLGGYGVSLAIRFGSNLIMTRLLVPEMFGVMAIASVLMVGLAMFSDLGLNQNIVQSRRGSDPDFLNTAWSVQIVRGLVLWGFALGVALAILLADRYGLMPQGSVYADPVLPAVIAALSFGTVIGGLASTKLAEASRNLALGRVTQLDIVSQLAGLACMLVWASFDRSIWVLVGGGLFAGIVRVILSHAWLPGTRNRWHWDRGAFREIFHFGKWIFASSILGFLVSSGDRLMLGFMVDASVLGVYAIAFLMFSAVEQVVTRIIGGIGFPALSEVARSGRDLKAAYYRFHAVIASVAYFCAGALMVSGQALVDVLYDARYADAGWMLQILAVALVVLPLHMAAQCYVALGKPRILSVIISIRLAGLLALIPLGFQYFAVFGALYAIVLSQLCYVPVIIFLSKRYGLFDVHREVLLLAVIPAGAIVGALFLWGAGH